MMKSDGNHVERLDRRVADVKSGKGERTEGEKATEG